MSHLAGILQPCHCHESGRAGVFRRKCCWSPEMIAPLFSNRHRVSCTVSWLGHTTDRHNTSPDSGSTAWLGRKGRGSAVGGPRHRTERLGKKLWQIGANCQWLQWYTSVVIPHHFTSNPLSHQLLHYYIRPTRPSRLPVQQSSLSL